MGWVGHGLAWPWSGFHIDRAGRGLGRPWAVLANDWSRAGLAVGGTTYGLVVGCPLIGVLGWAGYALAMGCAKHVLTMISAGHAMCSAWPARAGHVLGWDGHVLGLPWAGLTMGRSGYDLATGWLAMGYCGHGLGCPLAGHELG